MRQWDELNNAITELSTADLVRLRLVARIYDRRRYEDLLQEAICKTLSGERSWRDGVTLRWHLCQAMRSIASDWAKKVDENLVLESQLGADDDEANVLSIAAAAAPDPEQRAIARLELKRIIKRCESDSTVLSLLKSKFQGKTELEIRKELKLTRLDFLAAAQRLRRSVKNWRTEPLADARGSETPSEPRP